MKVGLYGNIVVDSVYSCGTWLSEGRNHESSEYSISNGGVMNVCRALFDLDKGIDIAVVSRMGVDLNAEHVISELQTMRKYVDTYMGYSRTHRTSASTIILTDSDRSSVVHWGACTKMDVRERANCDWNHFAYLDRLDNVTAEHLSAFRGIKSADLCKSEYTLDERAKIGSLLMQLDFVTISDVEALALTQCNDRHEAALCIGRNVKQKAIIHYHHGSFVSDGKTVWQFGHEPDYGVQALGAGDRFAAGFIASMLDGKSFNDSVIFAHENTRKYRGQNQFADPDCG